MLLRILTVAAGLLLSASSVDAAPLQAYGRLPNIEMAAISSDGTRLAMVVTEGERRRILIREVATGASKVMEVGDAKVRNLQWASPDHLLISSSTTASVANMWGPRREYTMLTSYDVAEGRMRPLLRDAEQSMNVVIGEPAVRMIDGQPFVFVQGIHFISNRGRLALFKVDLDGGGKSTLANPGLANTDDWVVGGDGEPLAQSEYDPKSGRWTLKVRHGGVWRDSKVLEGQTEWPSLLGLGRDGKTVLVEEQRDGRSVLREISPETGAWSEPFATADDPAVVMDPARHNLIGIGNLVGDEARVEFFDPADQRAWRSIITAYAGQSVELVSWSTDRKRVIVLVDSPTEGPTYAFVDWTTKSAAWIGGAYQEVTPADISPVQPMKFKSADGLELSGYLTTPKGREAKGLPLIVNPHGGPASRDVPGFDWWSQAMASRGYAVLQINYRGSSGYGRAFTEAGFGQWGRKMQTDLSDGVRHLAGEGVIDPKRVCIVGASYGGYAALAGPTLDPGVYRCAASISGISDLGRFVTWSKTQNGASAQRYWARFMGAENAADPVLAQISPASHVAGVAAPILLIHGRDDTVVPIEQSQIMERALKGAGKPVEFLVMDGEDHWLSRGETRLKMLQSVMAFVEKHNPAD